jgi:hypothetical protein
VPTAETVEGFITRNNAILDEINDLLDEATNKTLGQDERGRALGTAGHLACRRLRRLHAEEELWTHLRQERPTVFVDADLTIHRAPAGDQHQAPRVPVSAELLQLFGHPDPDKAEELIGQANRRLREVVQNPTGGIEQLIDEAQENVATLANETCPLVGKKGQQQRLLQLVRRSVGVLATANLTAAAVALQQHSWQAAPELLRHATELLERAGYGTDALPVVSLIAGAAVAIEAGNAARAARSVSRGDRAPRPAPADWRRKRPPDRTHAETKQPGHTKPSRRIGRERPGRDER